MITTNEDAVCPIEFHVDCDICGEDCSHDWSEYHYDNRRLDVCGRCRDGNRVSDEWGRSN